MVLIQINLSNGPHSKFAESDDNFLIAAWNRVVSPTLTAENIATRKHRPFLFQITEDLNMASCKSFDILDVLCRLQQLRKADRLGRYEFGKLVTRSGTKQGDSV